MNIDAMNSDYDDDFKVKSFGFQSLPADTTIKVEDRQDSVAIRKTQSIAAAHITPDMPHPSDASLIDRVTVGAPAPLGIEPESKAVPMEIDSLSAEVLQATQDLESAQRVEAQLESNIEALQELESALINENPPEPAILQFPNLAWESVSLGLAKERETNETLNNHIAESRKIQKQIDLCLDLSAELMQHKPADGATVELSEKAKAILNELKELGIDLWKNEDHSLSKESISELKSLSGAQVDKLRSNLQIIFTTKIQTLIQMIGSILECVKDIVRNNTKLLSAINNKMSGR